MHWFTRWMAAAIVFLAQPALADKNYAVTPSGATEKVFGDRPAAVVGAIASKCIDAKWTVISSTPSELVCEAPMNFGQSLVGQLLMGNSYSTPPRRFFRFNVADVNGLSRVQASGWMELQMAFGQTKRTDFTGPEFHNSVMNFLSSAGGKFPMGTTFPNHVSMGIQIEGVTLGKFAGLKVTQVEPGSAAAGAGIRAGDIITGLAGKKFKDSAGHLDGAERAASLTNYPVEILRDGKSMSLTVARAFRPAYAEAIERHADQAAAATTPTGSASVADELAKLVTLKERGVLTQAEFEAQKQKLLSR